MTEALRDSVLPADALARAANGAALRCYGPAAGEFLPTHHELAAQKDRAEAKVAELQAQLARLQRS